MNTVKSFLAAAIIVTLSIVTGCSDDITSPVTQSKIKKESTITAQEDISRNVYHSTVNLKPHQTYTFSYENTGFYSFNSISVLNCDLITNGTEIYGYLDDEILSLGCNSKGFWVWSISIYNTSSQFIDLDVTLTGSKTRVPNPTPKINNAD